MPPISLDELFLWIFKGILTFLFGMFAWMLKKQTSRIDMLEKELGNTRELITDVRIDLPTNYLTKTDFKDFESRLFDKLEDIEKTLRK